MDLKILSGIVIRLLRRPQFTSYMYFVYTRTYFWHRTSTGEVEIDVWHGN